MGFEVDDLEQRAGPASAASWPPIHVRRLTILYSVRPGPSSCQYAGDDRLGDETHACDPIFVN